MTPRYARALLAAALVALTAAAGCGIKGPLTLPEKSENIVIRAPGTPAPAEGTATTPAAGSPAGEDTTQPPAKPKPDRLPPPPLPASNPGTGQGG
jgi:predicted small lipoprotein YifL